MDTLILADDIFRAATELRIARSGMFRPNPCSSDENPVIPRYPGDTWADWFAQHPDAEPDTGGAMGDGTLT